MGAGVKTCGHQELCFYVDEMSPAPALLSMMSTMNK